ncbi:GDSL-type esterase/lipase family protein [Parafilimonas terrae]|uniref:Acetyl esterase/lipase n=1 Tax=Parafilimonas terrae TaxID=1465490 RepID=A0A1I5YLI6_9BACT|nr:GDSL-type esterase/lipase family protein [Parafilimonas terrae]SFQ45124.1 Acetyl esterase/lipase [Parafilimonas terrae]
MKNFFGSLLLLFLTLNINAQKVIPLYNGAAPGSENWNWEEARQDSNVFHTPIVYNVSHPTLTVYLPDPAAPKTNTAVVIAPGGGFHLLSINSEGVDVAKWLNKKGITCFVLKYRLVHSKTDNPIQEMMDMINGKGGNNEETKSAIVMAIADGREAISYVRKHAAEYNIDANKIGIMGFSAGGTVAASAAFNYTADNKPDFVAPVYPFFPDNMQTDVAADAPPMFITAASDDQLGLAPHSVSLYNKWVATKHPAELHMYVKGGHGFGMRKQNIPTDNWIERFGDWLSVMGITNTAESLNAQQVEWMQGTLKDWPNIKRYDEANQQLKSKPAVKDRVVFMGNSITDGWINSDPDFFSKNPYIDRGISGQTTPQMLARFREDVIDLKPAAVVILAGINDIAQNTGYIRPEDTYGNIISMAELAKANNIKVVICSILPAYDFPWRPGMQPAEKVVAINKMLKDYADKNHIVYVDYFSAMADERKGLPEKLSKDGVHPTLDGYKIMEPLVQKGIAEALKK